MTPPGEARGPDVYAAARRLSSSISDEALLTMAPAAVAALMGLREVLRAPVVDVDRLYGRPPDEARGPDVDPFFDDVNFGESGGDIPDRTPTGWPDEARGPEPMNETLVAISEAAHAHYNEKYGTRPRPWIDSALSALPAPVAGADEAWEALIVATEPGQYPNAQKRLRAGVARHRPLIEAAILHDALPAEFVRGWHEGHAQGLHDARERGCPQCAAWHDIGHNEANAALSSRVPEKGDDHDR